MELPSEGKSGTWFVVGFRPSIGSAFAKECAAREEGVNRGDEVSSGARFVDESLGARVANLAEDSRRFVHGKHQKGGGKTPPGDFIRDFEAAHIRHGDIEDGDIRLERLYGLQSFGPRGGLAGDFPFGARAEKHGTHTMADHFMVVDDENLGGRVTSPSADPGRAMRARSYFSSGKLARTVVPCLSDDNCSEPPS